MKWKTWDNWYRGVCNVFFSSNQEYPQTHFPAADKELHAGNDLRSHLFAIQEALTRIQEENKDLSKELISIREENKGMAKTLPAAQKENKAMSDRVIRMGRDIYEVIPDKPIYWHNEFERSIVKANWGKVTEEPDFEEKVSPSNLWAR